MTLTHPESCTLFNERKQKRIQVYQGFKALMLTLTIQPSWTFLSKISTVRRGYSNLNCLSGHFMGLQPIFNICNIFLSALVSKNHTLPTACTPFPFTEWGSLSQKPLVISYYFYVTWWWIINNETFRMHNGYTALPGQTRFIMHHSKDSAGSCAEPQSSLPNKTCRWWAKTHSNFATKVSGLQKQ